MEKNKFKFLEILYEDVFWNLETLCLTSNIKFIDKAYYYYRINREGSIMKITKDIEKKKQKNIEFVKKQKRSYIEIYKNMEVFLRNKKNIFDIKKILYILLELNYWKIQARVEIIDITEIRKIREIMEVENIISKEEIKVLDKKFKDILRNKNIKDIVGLNIFDSFLWRKKIMDKKILCRRLKINTKNLLFKYFCKVEDKN